MKRICRRRNAGTASVVDKKGQKPEAVNCKGDRCILLESKPIDAKIH